MRRLYDWTLKQADHPYALWVLAAIAFIESSIFPIPPDVLMAPMILAARDRAWLIAGVATVASVAGGAMGYWIGWGLYDSVGAAVLNFYGKEGYFETFRETYTEYGAWAVFVAGLTPFPYKVITIASGALSLDFWVFMFSSVLARGLRFFVVAALFWRFGPPIKSFIDRHFGLVTIVFTVLLIGGFVAIKYII